MTSELATEELGAKVNSITDTIQVDMNASVSYSRHLNVIVRNVSESVNEHISDKINSLIKVILVNIVNVVNVSDARRITSN